MTRYAILFLAARQSETDAHALDREAHSIRAELKRSGYRDRFEFHTRWAMEPLDLLRELRELKPAVVHFSGHGGRGVSFPSASGSSRTVSPAAIAETFGAAGSSVKLVVLSACFDDAIAEALLAHVDCVVGLGGAIHGDAARSFAIGFYGGLGEHASVAAAYRHGKAAISLDGMTDAELPQLRVGAGCDASSLVLAATAPAPRAELPCPYPGMRPYAADDADAFHGRSAEIDELLGRLRAGEREIYVIGPSGSGKSSLVSAGVLPRLARGLPGLGPFTVRSMRPGEHPGMRLAELLEPDQVQSSAPVDAVAALLAHRGTGSSVLIVIDQLEELFTLASPAERTSFLAALHALRAEPRCAMIFTLRADFFGAFMESPLWKERRGRIARIEVGPLAGDALREAIAEPARRLDVAVEPALVERLLADAASEPGILPLLQDTMVQLWDRRREQTLSLADYEAMGDDERNGLAVALARRADATLRALTSTQEVIARRILLRLVSFGDGRSDTRRQQPLSKLRATSEDASDFDRVFRRMIADRLLITDEDDGGREPSVDLAHEVMIHAWPTLADWLQTHRAAEQRRRQLEAAATRWVEYGRGARGLLDPIELTEAEAWQQTDSARELGRSAAIAELAAASRAVLDRQRRRRRTLVGAAFSAMTVFAVVVASLAMVAHRRAGDAEISSERAEISRNHADANAREKATLLARVYQETGRALLLDGRPQEATPYFVAARQAGEEGESLRMLFWAATRALPLVSPLQHEHWVRSAAFSPDGTRVVTASVDHTARIWDTASGKLLASPLRHQEPVVTAAFSPDGARVITASIDSTARIWDAASGKPVTGPLEHGGPVRAVVFSFDGARVITTSDDNTARLWDARSGEPLTAPLRHLGAVWSAAFSPDAARVVTASDDGSAQLWDAASGKPLGSPLRHRSAVVAVAFSRDGTHIVTASTDKTARLWDAASGEPVGAPLQHQKSVWSAAFSTDGTRVVTASGDHTARIWSATSGQPVTAPLLHQKTVLSAVFSSDGTRVVTASGDFTARIWDAITGVALTSPLQHQRPVLRAAFSPDGRRVVTASDDQTARIWDATAGHALVSAFRHRGWVRTAAFSPDGARVITASDDNTAQLWDPVSGTPLAAPLRHHGWVRSAAFSPDGTRVVTASDDHTARIWDAASGELLAAPLRHQGVVRTAVFSPDATRIVTASDDGTAQIWDAVSGHLLAPALRHQAWVRSAAFSPDSTRVVTASHEAAQIWDVASGRLLTPPLQHHGSVMTAAFSPDGTRVVTASIDQTARVWDAASGAPLSSPLPHQGWVWSAAFSRDGARVITTADDNTARLWSAASGKPLGAPLEHRGRVRSVAFSPDGTRIITASDDGTARIWDTVSGKPLASPFEHRGKVLCAGFSPDGTRVVTAGDDDAARVWEIGLAGGTLARWFALAERSPFMLSDGGPVPRAPRLDGVSTNSTPPPHSAGAATH